VARGHLGLDRVALAAPTTGARVGLVDLYDLQALAAPVAHESGRVASGRLSAQCADRAKPVGPAKQAGVAAGVSREGPHPHGPAAVVQDRGVVGVGVCVDPDHDLAIRGCHAGHRRPAVRVDGAARGGRTEQ